MPDTFSPAPNANPKELSIFQEFNLSLTNENKAISRKIKKKDVIKFISLITKGIISKRSALRAMKHIIKEKINVKYKAERSLIQNVLSFNIYLKYLYKYKPSFSTYFTNHVAGMMHRYWKNLFPNDFGLNKNEIDSFYSKSIFKAMDLADKNLLKLIKFSDEHNYNLLVISSMGQEAIERGEYIPELVIRDFQKLINAIDLDPKNYKLLPAMQPDYCFETKNKKSMKKLRENIKFLTDNDGNQFLVERYQPVSLKINLSLKNPHSISTSKVCKFGKISYKINDIGFELINRDIGTGYHIPEGILFWYGDKSESIKKYNKEKIDICRISPTILKIYGIKIPSYMQKPLKIK